MPAEEALEGLTIEQYAGITAALDEEHPADAVLANEGLDAEGWKQADAAWKAKLATDGAEGPTFTAFRQKRGEAEDFLGRAIKPIDQDLEGWLAFLRTWSAHPSPFEMLSRQGMRMNDVARLQRSWGKRLADDKDLAKKAAELTKKGAGPLPAITVAPSALKPFPWSRGPARAPDPPAAEPAEPGAPLGDSDFTLDRYAALSAELAERPGDREAVLAKHGMGAAELQAVEGALKQRFAADAELERDYRLLFEYQRARIRNAARTPVSPSAVEPEPEPAPAPLPPAAILKRLASTSLSLDIPRGPALPFMAGASPNEVSARLPSAPRKAPVGSGTSVAVDVPRGPALPFAGAEPPRPAPPALAGTAIALDVPRGPALPFDKDAKPALPEEAPKPRDPVKERLGGTAIALDVPRGPATPFERAKAGGALGWKLPENLPPPKHLAAKEAPPPALTLEQHASLTVELTAAPDHAAATLARYRITAAQKEAADRSLAERMSREPGLREAWDRAFETYRVWYLDHMRKV